MQKVGGIWSFIIFHRIHFEGANAESWRDLEPHTFLQILFEQKVGGIWSPINLCRILF